MCVSVNNELNAELTAAHFLTLSSRHFQLFPSSNPSDLTFNYSLCEVACVRAFLNPVGDLEARQLKVHIGLDYVLKSKNFRSGSVVMVKIGTPLCQRSVLMGI